MKGIIHSFVPSPYKMLIIGVWLIFFPALTRAEPPQDLSLQKQLEEVVARFPAPSVTERDEAAEEFLRLGQRGVLAACRMLSAPGERDDSAVRFALHGITMSVNRPGSEKYRALYTQALLKALREEDNPEIMAFLISQVQLVGKDDAVKALAGYLEHPRLSDPAAQALLAIHTARAEEALLKALPEVSGDRKVIIIRALGEMRSHKSLGYIHPFTQASDPELREVSLFALANIGDPSSEAALSRFSILASAYERNRASSRLLLFARRLGEAGYRKHAARICQGMIEHYTSPRESQISCAALAILKETLGETALGDMLRAMDSPLRDVRVRALALAEGIPGKEVTSMWLHELPERPEKVQAEIIAMLGRRGDETALPALRDALRSPSPLVRVAAVKAASRIGGVAVLEDLWPLMESREPEEIAAVQQAFLRFPSERVVPEAIARLGHSGPLAQAALLELLAERRAQDAAGQAFDLLSNGEAAVRKAALTALKDLVKSEDIGRVIELLLKTETRSEIPVIQDALVAGALQISAEEERAASILTAYGEIPEERRPDLLRPLARIGGEAALNLVIRETRNSNSRIRAAAVYALSQWPELEAAGELIRICRDAPDRKVLYTALQGYVRLVGEANLPAAQKTALLEEAMEMELGTQEKNLILGGLARIKSSAALELAARFLDEPEVRDRAARIVLRIALPEAGVDGPAEGEIVPILIRARPFIADEQEQKQIDSRIDQLMRREGFVPLFNGKNLDGWMGDTQGYAAEDGVIVVHPDRGSGNLYTEEQYADFILRFEFRLTPGANNGLGIRTPPEGDAAYVGMELQILDNDSPKYRDLKPYQYHGSIYGVVAAKRGYQKPVGEWNHQEVRAIGPRVTVILNGEVIVDADIREASASGTMDGREHPGLQRDRGHIGFLGHGSRVEFRNLWIKTVDPKG